jgi:Tfp pilus assembly protein FimT
VIFVTAAVGIVVAAAVPQLNASIEHTRTIGAARYLAERFASARAQAVARSANVAILITIAGEDTTVGTYADGNGNGVRTREIAAGIDFVAGPSLRLNVEFPHVGVYLSDPPDPSLTSAVMSFTPLGTASSATWYLRGRDGSQYAVRVLGATGRTRVLRFETRSRTWVEVL